MMITDTTVCKILDNAIRGVQYSAKINKEFMDNNGLAVVNLASLEVDFWAN